MPDNPNLFPALTEEDRARLAAIAGNLETLPQLLERLMQGIGNDRQRAGTPGLIYVPETDQVRRDPLTPQPLSINDAGHLRVTTRATFVRGPTLTIAAGAVLSNVVTTAEWPVLTFASGMLVYDDFTRLAAEVIDGVSTLSDPVQLAPADWHLAASGLLGATIGIVSAMSVLGTAGPALALRSRAVVGAGGRVFRTLIRMGV